MLVGLAKDDITPAGPVDLSGYVARTGQSEGMHDPVYCRALVLGQGSRRLALIACDTLCFGLEYSTQVKLVVESATGIPAPHIMLAATHTHSAPASGYQIGCGELAHDWLASLPARVANTVGRAQSAMMEVQPSLAAVTVPGLAGNRREPDGAVDHRLHALRLKDAQGRDRGTVLHFPCHAVVLGADNRLISADYPGVLCREVEARTGAPCLFLQGPSGNINPLQRGSFASCEAMGARLAEAVLDAMDHGGPWSQLRGDVLRLRTLEVDLPLTELPTYSELVAFRDEHRAALASPAGTHSPGEANVHRAMLTWAESTLVSYCSCVTTHRVRLPLQSLQLGNLCLIGVPAELFVEFGLEAEASATAVNRHALLVYANGDAGYVAPKQAYAAELYGYEIGGAYRYYGLPAGYAPEAPDLLVAAIGNLIEASGDIEGDA